MCSRLLSGFGEVLVDDADEEVADDNDELELSGEFLFDDDTVVVVAELPDTGWLLH